MNMVPMFPLKLSMKPQQTHKNCPFPEHPFSDVVVFFAKAVCFFWRILENEIAQVESLAALRKEWMLGSSQKRDIIDGWLMFHGWIDIYDIYIYVYSYIHPN